MSTSEPTPGERGRLSKWRRTFGLAFVASTGIFLLLTTVLFALGAVPGLVPIWPLRPTPSRTPTATVTPTPGHTGTASPSPFPTRPPTPTPARDLPGVVPLEAPGLALLTGIVGIAASCLASVTTFVGFVVATAMTISKDRRDARDAELELRKRELELEKQKLELEELKRQRKPPDKGQEAGS